MVEKLLDKEGVDVKSSDDSRFWSNPEGFSLLSTVKDQILYKLRFKCCKDNVEVLSLKLFWFCNPLIRHVSKELRYLLSHGPDLGWCKLRPKWNTEMDNINLVEVLLSESHDVMKVLK